MPYIVKGVDILSTQDYYKPTVLSCILMLIVNIVICIILSKLYMLDSITVIMLLAMNVIFIIFCSAPDSILTYNKYLSCHYVTEYKVTISDEVSMNELLSHYEIISQDEKIYILKEKSNGK